MREILPHFLALLITSGVQLFLRPHFYALICVIGQWPEIQIDIVNRIGSITTKLGNDGTPAEQRNDGTTERRGRPRETERSLGYRRSKTCVVGPWTRGGAARRGQRLTERPPRLEDGVKTESNENKSCQT